MTGVVVVVSAVVVAATSVASAGVPTVVFVALAPFDGELHPAKTTTQARARVAIVRRCTDMVRGRVGGANKYL
jgi:hypothetical protein